MYASANRYSPFSIKVLLLFFSFFASLNNKNDVTITVHYFSSHLLSSLSAWFTRSAWLCRGLGSGTHRARCVVVSGLSYNAHSAD